MNRLVIVDGPAAGKAFPVGERDVIIGRSDDADITLHGVNVSRRHARVFRDGDGCFVEDLGSRNGTFVNDSRITGRVSLAANDRLKVGGHLIRFEGGGAEEDLTIQSQTAVLASNPVLFRENAGEKLKAVLQLAHRLSNSLDAEQLLNVALAQLLEMFPNADRALMLDFGSAGPALRACRTRVGNETAANLFSRSVAKAVLEKRMAILAEDTRTFEGNLSICAIGIRSLMCVPLVTSRNEVHSAIQVDRLRLGSPFTPEDLHLLTAVALQIATVLENAVLHQELVKQERIQSELALAREIQQSFLPRAMPVFPGVNVELHADLSPALEVSGDFYDCLVLDESRLALVVADVSGKGMSAALFMAMVRALWRQLAQQPGSPSEIVMRLNDAVAGENPKCMFVTFLLAVYQVNTGECTLVRAGHPAPLLRRANGRVEEVASDPGVLLGIESICRTLQETQVRLDGRDALLLYTDGVTETVGGDSSEMFGVHRLAASFSQLAESAPLATGASAIRQAVQTFSGGKGPQDDLTLVLLRRGKPGTPRAEGVRDDY